MAVHSGSPVEPKPSGWQFPSPLASSPDDLVAIGADLAPGTLLNAYRAGYFPMPLEPEGSIGWWSPDPRGVLEVEQFEPSRSLRRSIRRYEIRVDTAFDAVVTSCAQSNRPHGWIDGPIQAAYIGLHEMGWVHSIEAWDAEGLAGGLYGVSIGNFFAGESMFHVRRDASKVALVALVEILKRHRGGLLDVQWTTHHLESLGARAIERSAYLERLRDATALPGPDWAVTGHYSQ